VTVANLTNGVLIELGRRAPGTVNESAMGTAQRHSGGSNILLRGAVMLART